MANQPNEIIMKTSNNSSARERAIAKLLEGSQESAPKASNSPAIQSQQTPVANPSSVSPEEFVGLNSAPKTELNNTSVGDASEQSNAPTATKSVEVSDKSADGHSDPSNNATPLSTQYAQLARKEKAMRAKVQELKAKEDAAKAREEALQAKESELQSMSSLKDRLAQDPISVLGELGISYDKITELMLNQPSPEKLAMEQMIQEMRNEIKTLKGEQESAKERAKLDQQNAYKQAVNQIRTDVKKLVYTDETYETIKETGSVEDVVELIEQTFKETNELLSVEEACRQVEEYLLEEALKLTKLKKIQSRLKPAESQKPAEELKPSIESKQTQQPKTLTNNMTASRPLSARERAIAVMEGRQIK